MVLLEKKNNFKEDKTLCFAFSEPKYEGRNNLIFYIIKVPLSSFLIVLFDVDESMMSSTKLRRRGMIEDNLPWKLHSLPWHTRANLPPTPCIHVQDTNFVYILTNLSCILAAIPLSGAFAQFNAWQKHCIISFFFILFSLFGSMKPF